MAKIVPDARSVNCWPNLQPNWGSNLELNQVKAPGGQILKTLQEAQRTMDIRSIYRVISTTEIETSGTDYLGYRVISQYPGTNVPLATL